MSMLRRMNSRAAIRATLRPQITTAQQDDKPAVVAEVNIDALDNEELGGEVVKTTKFAVTCAMTNGGASIGFSAQLKGGKSFWVSPYMPKDAYGNPQIPDTVVNSAQGYLVLRISENSKLEVLDTGRMQYTIRPNFVAFERTFEAAEKARAAEEARLADEAKRETKPETKPEAKPRA